MRIHFFQFRSQLPQLLPQQLPAARTSHNLPVQVDQVQETRSEDAVFHLIVLTKTTISAYSMTEIQSTHFNLNCPCIKRLRLHFVLSG